MSLRKFIKCAFVCLFISNLSAGEEIQIWPLSNVHVMGDSHSRFCFSTKERKSILDNFLYEREGVKYEIPIQKHWLGPRLMYSFGVRGVEDKYFEGINIGDFLVFVLGAIDVKWHMHNQLKDSGRKIEELSDALVSGYIDKINYYQKIYKFTPIVMGLVPPSVSCQSIKRTPGGEGSVQERVSYTNVMNSRLKESCRINGILYFDIHDEYSTEEGFLDPSRAIGSHILVKHNLLAKIKLCDFLWDNYNFLAEDF